MKENQSQKQVNINIVTTNNNSQQQQSNNIRVFIRVRPFKQSQNKLQSCIYQMHQQTIIMKDKESNSNLQFTFDKVLQPQISQEEVYQAVAHNVIQNGLEGINGTIFAYGQTSSGKTHTCIGPNYTDQKHKGLLPRMISNILKKGQNRPATLEFRVKLSMVEIYNQKIKDLLDISKDNLKIRSNKSKGIYIQDVTQKILSSYEQAQLFLKKGIENRSVGCTNMNAQSSRSHMVFLITIYQNNFLTGQAKTAKITLIDLAGSQKISKTGAEGKVLQQAKQINKSLSALGKVINALCQNKTKNTHIPYRDSKLTRLLQESLGGNSLTSLIVNVSPSSFNQSQTLSSLRFGYRAKSIQNKPKVNKQYTIEQLTKMLQKAQKKVKDQQKIIQSYQKKKRIGGYGCFSATQGITLHVLNSSSQDSESQINNNSDKSINQPNGTSVSNPQICIKTVSKQKAPNIKIINNKPSVLADQMKDKTQRQSMLSIAQNLNNQQGRCLLGLGDFYTNENDNENQQNKKQKQVRISFLDNNFHLNLKSNQQICSQNQNSNSRRGILNNVTGLTINDQNQQRSKQNSKQKQKQKETCLYYQQNPRKQSIRKKSRVTIQQKQNVIVIQNCQDSKQSLKSITQDHKQSLSILNDKIIFLEETLQQQRTKYGDLLLKFSNLRSQSSINKMMIDRKNQIIQNLRNKINNMTKQLNQE